MKKINKLVGDYYHHRFEDCGSIISKDYAKFQKKYKSIIKEIAEKISMELIDFLPGHYEFSAILKAKDTPHHFKISIPDVRFWWDEWCDDILIGHYNPEDKKIEMRSYVSIFDLDSELADLHQWYLR